MHYKFETDRRNFRFSIVSAFAPSSKRACSSSLKMGFEGALGAQPPLGFWDPLGLLKNADQERFDRLRSVIYFHKTCV